jgi:hypothetical protein
MCGKGVASCSAMVGKAEHGEVKMEVVCKGSKLYITHYFMSIRVDASVYSLDPVAESLASDRTRTRSTLSSELHAHPFAYSFADVKANSVRVVESWPRRRLIRLQTRVGRGRGWPTAEKRRRACLLISSIASGALA